MTDDVLQTILKLSGIAGAIVTLILGIINHKKLAIKIGAGMVVFIGIMVIIGHLLDAPQVYKMPGDSIGMALLTAICIITLGGCLWIIADDDYWKRITKK